MDLFANLQWRVSEPTVLEVETNFISEEIAAESLVFQNNLVPYESDEEEPLKNTPNKSKNLPKNSKNQAKNKFMYFQKSRLNKVEHKQCLEALQLLETDRPVNSLTQKEQQLINIYNNLKSVINVEHEEFLKFLEQRWNKKLCLRTANFNKNLHKFALAKREQKFETIKNYPPIYIDNKMIPICNNQNNFELIHQGLLLELGTMGKLIVPDLDKNMYINKLPPLHFKDPDEIVEITKLSVSDDIHAEYLAKQTGCKIVISSSSLKTIIDNFGPDFNGNWDIPIIVKEYAVGEKKFNVTYINKTLPQKNITLKDLEYYVRKVLLKRCTSSIADYSFKTPKYILDNFNAHKNQTSCETAECSTLEKQINTEMKSPMKTNDNSSEIKSPITKSDDRSVEIESPMETNASSSKTTECTTPKKQKNNEVEKSPSKMMTRSATKQCIKKELIKMETDEEGEIKDDPKPKPTTKQRKNKNNFNHNVNYRLWGLKVQEEENILMKNCAEKGEIKLLVRSKIDANLLQENGEKLAIHLAPKLEYQYEHGGEILTKSELLRQWITLCFRPFSSMLRVRIFPNSNQYLKFENINLNKATNECLKQNINPKDSLGVLYNVLSHLTDLEPGQYILHHTPKHGPFVALMKSVPRNTAGLLIFLFLLKLGGDTAHLAAGSGCVYLFASHLGRMSSSLNLYDLYSAENCSISETSKWIPIDKTVILSHHINSGTLPGIFPPQIIGKNKRNNRKNKKQNVVSCETNSDC